MRAMDSAVVCIYFDISDETCCEQPPGELDVFELRERDHVRKARIVHLRHYPRAKLHIAV